MNVESLAQVNEYYDNVVLYDFIVKMIANLERLEMRGNKHYKSLLRSLKRYLKKLDNDDSIKII